MLLLHGSLHHTCTNIRSMHAPSAILLLPESLEALFRLSGPRLVANLSEPQPRRSRISCCADYATIDHCALLLLLPRCAFVIFRSLLCQQARHRHGQPELVNSLVPCQPIYLLSLSAGRQDPALLYHVFLSDPSRIRNSQVYGEAESNISTEKRRRHRRRS